jgi:hypothetical protein
MFVGFIKLYNDHSAKVHKHFSTGLIAMGENKIHLDVVSRT